MAADGCNSLLDGLVTLFQGMLPILLIEAACQSVTSGIFPPLSPAIREKMLLLVNYYVTRPLRYYAERDHFKLIRPEFAPAYNLQ